MPPAMKLSRGGVNCARRGDVPYALSGPAAPPPPTEAEPEAVYVEPGDDMDGLRGTGVFCRLPCREVDEMEPSRDLALAAPCALLPAIGLPATEGGRGDDTGEICRNDPPGLRPRT